LTPKFRQKPSRTPDKIEEEKSVVDSKGVYEYLERQYKAHYEKERVRRIREKGYTYRQIDKLKVLVDKVMDF
jgi:uncharacterized Zn finger protein (UPF0148 family)